MRSFAKHNDRSHAQRAIESIIVESGAEVDVRITAAVLMDFHQFEGFDACTDDGVRVGTLATHWLGVVARGEQRSLGLSVELFYLQTEDTLSVLVEAAAPEEEAAVGSSLTYGQNLTAGRVSWQDKLSVMVGYIDQGRATLQPGDDFTIIAPEASGWSGADKWFLGVAVPRWHLGWHTQISAEDEEIETFAVNLSGVPIGETGFKVGGLVRYLEDEGDVPAEVTVTLPGDRLLVGAVMEFEGPVIVLRK